MNYEEIFTLFTKEMPDLVLESQEDLDINLLDEVGEYLIIGKYGVFPVFATKPTYNRDVRAIDVYQANQDDLGGLVLTKGRKFNDFSELTLQEFLAYLVDVSGEEYGSMPYTLKKDYFVSAPDMAYLYIGEYLKTSPIWGGFTHYALADDDSKTITQLVASKEILTPSLHHTEAFARISHAPSSLYSFLRLYQCIELLFDVITVLRVKSLTTNIRDFQSILTDHGRTELNRLQMIGTQFISDFDSIVQVMRNITPHKDVAKKIFQDYNKDGNPLNPEGDARKWDNLMEALEVPITSKDTLKAKGIFKNESEYSAVVIKISCYWIYRVRCCIAHSRIGEYVFEDSDQKFVFEFAEPLILEFIRQVFSSSKLKLLIEA